MFQHPEMEEIYVPSYSFIDRTLLPTLMTARLSNKEGVVLINIYFFASFFFTFYWLHTMLMTARLPNQERVVIWGKDIRDRWKPGAHPDKCNQVLWLPEFVKLTTASPPGSTQVKWVEKYEIKSCWKWRHFAEEGIRIRTFAIILKTQVELKSKPNWSSWRVGSTIQAVAAVLGANM